MSLAEAFRTLVLQSADVAAMVDSRVYTDQMPQTAKTPAVAFFVVTETANNCLDRGGYFDEATMQVESYGQTRIEADTLWKLVRNQIDGFVGLSAGIKLKVSQSSGRYWMTDRPEEGSDFWRYGSVQDFTVFYASD